MIVIIILNVAILPDLMVFDSEKMKLAINMGIAISMKFAVMVTKFVDGSDAIIYRKKTNSHAIGFEEYSCVQKKAVAKTKTSLGKKSPMPIHACANGNVVSTRTMIEITKNSFLCFRYAILILT